MSNHARHERALQMEQTMAKLGLETEIIDRAVYEGSVRRFREAQILLPTFGQLADPRRIPQPVQRALQAVDPDEPHPLNLFRVHWFNSRDRRRIVELPEHLVLPPELTGVAAPIVLLLGERFPMINAHKVLAAYGCLAPRLLTGQFDPTVHKAVWPSTGNYCRGGVAISRIMRCRGVAVLPEEMSHERFAWLERWVTAAEDIIKTPGSESNVKEIYDKCAELERDPQMIIFNQFCEFGNTLVHYLCTGRALSAVYEQLKERQPTLRLAGFVSATGSAGTIAAGDLLKEQYGAAIVAAEALECPTLLSNGFGAHNIQGIGDKHVPLIHNVMNTDAVSAISERSTDSLDLLFNTDVGRAYLRDRRGVPAPIVERLGDLGLSSLCNVLSAIKLARSQDLGPDDAVLTVATDSAANYVADRPRLQAKYFPRGFDEVAAGEVFGEHLLGCGVDNFLELSRAERKRIFNLGYYTWVEQQGVTLEEFTRRREQRFWWDLRALIPAWDAMIEAFNAETGVKIA